jgi:thiol-disulfide isomerase/thioredoxin
MKKLFTCLSFALLSAGYSQAQLANYSVGETAPDFTVTDIHGHTHHLSDYAGKWVILDFFAYWCGPCAGIAPIVNEFYRKYGCNNYDIVVIALEYEGTTAQTVAFEDANGGDPNYPTPSVSGLDGGAAAVHSTYGASAFPTVVLIGTDGKFKNIDIWPIGSVSAIETALTNAGGSAAMVPHTCVLNVSEMTVDASSLYPNPTTGNATISVTAPNSETADLSIWSVSGELISTTTHQLEGGQNLLTIDMSTLKAGTYFVRIGNDAVVSSMIPVVKN